MTVSAAEEIESSRFGLFHRLIIGLIGLTVVFDGYDTFVPAYVISAVAGPKGAWHLSHTQAGFLVSSGLFGFMIGALVHGSIADRIGRRATLLGGMWISGVFSLATAIFANDDGTFLILRVLTGLGLGTLLPLCTTYITEFSPARGRNAFVVWGAAVGWASGAIVASLVGIWLTPRFGWHALFWFASLSLIVAAISQVWLPESPRFLALRARFGELALLLARIRPERAEIYRGATFVIPAVLAGSGSPLALLAPAFRRNTIIIWVCAFFVLFDIYGLGGWLPPVMMTRGETPSASFGYGALLQIASLLGAFACGAIADRRGGRRMPLAVWWLLGAASVLLLAVVNTHVTNALLIFAAGFFVIGGQFILNNFTAVAYPTELRATGVGMELGIGRVGGILGPYIGGAIQDAFGGANGFFAAMALASLLSALAIWFSRPVAGDISAAPTMPQDAVA
ncbi:MAG TPA: MFS transporter [Candidatus Sulfotelmatobacter sp.]|nr:MFS transporter [Candidatus Sulfotelmatobacter sp.]